MLVDPFVGTLADYGQLSPAAVAPYGMVQLDLNTDPANHAGVDFSAGRLAGFSHARGVGVGCSGAGGDVRVMLDYAGAAPLARINKRAEAAHAGYYRVSYRPDRREFLCRQELSDRQTGHVEGLRRHAGRLL